MAADVPMAYEPVPQSDDDELQVASAFEGFDVESSEDEEGKSHADEDEDVESHQRSEQSEQSDRFSESAEEPEKDEIEKELERLVFGDSDGFREAIRDGVSYEDYGEEYEEEEGPLTSLQDSDLFYIDSGPSDATSTIAHKQLVRSDHAHAVGKIQEPAAAWEDSDDERMSVSLMAIPRLRKLREFDGEDVIPGREYIRRLRRQYEVLHPRPAWADWDPEKGRARKRRKRRHHHQAGSIDGSASSSSAGSSDDDDSGEDEELSTQPLTELLRSAEPLTGGQRPRGSKNQKRIKLRSQVIAIERMKDIGPTQPHAITSLSIHPTLPLILSSGLSSTLYLHYLHPRPIPPDAANPVVTSLHLKHTPLSTTAFSAPCYPAGADSLQEQPKIYLSGRRRYFHVWDLASGEIQKVTRVYGQQESQRSMEILKPSPCGRWIALQGSSRKGGGVINILDASTLQWSTQVRADGYRGLADFCWWADGSGMSIVGKGGEVAEWSARERRIVARWQDEGAVGVTVLSLGGGSASAGGSSSKMELGPDRYVAVGSSTGIVNLYAREALLQLLRASSSSSQPPPPPQQQQQQPAPIRAFDTLTTSITHLAFSPCGQVLAMASRWKRDALRLVHVPTATVYRNWPTSKTPLGRISALCLGEYDDSDISLPAPTSTTGAGAANGGGGGNVTTAVYNRRKSIVLCVGNEAGALRAWEITG